MTTSELFKLKTGDEINYRNSRAVFVSVNFSGECTIKVKSRKVKVDLSEISVIQKLK